MSLSTLFLRLLREWPLVPPIHVRPNPPAQLKAGDYAARVTAATNGSLTITITGLIPTPKK